MKLLLLLFPLLCSAHTLDNTHAAYLRGEAATTFTEAEAAFNEALAGYLAAPGSSPWLSFDLGNTYFQLGEPATALYHYSRAQQLAPRNRQIRAHLRLASKKLGVTPKTPLPHKLCAATLLAPHERNILIAICGALATLLAAFAIQLKNKKILKLSLFPATLAILFSLTLIYLNILADPGAILLKSATLRRDAGVNYAAVCDHPLAPGTRVRLTNQRGEWAKIILPSGEAGFVLADSLGIL